MLDQSEVMFYLVACEIILKLLVNEQGSVIGNHGIRYFEVVENVSLDKPPGLCHCDGR